MQEAGVELIVKGLQSFVSDMGKANSALQNLRAPQTMLQRGFEGLADMVGNFARSVVNIAEVTLGVLFRDAILGAIDLMRNLGSAILDAASEFQGFEMRLDRMNLNELTEQGLDYVEAQKLSVEMTQEQLDWALRLAAASPFDATDVTRQYTLARSYGFTADEAKGLVESIIDFSSGMALGNTEMERIIVNFGQLRAQGKLNSQELRDLARGAFVPVNDIMQIMSENMTESGAIVADYSEEISDLQKKINDYKQDLQIALQKQTEWTDTVDNTDAINKLQEKIRGYEEDLEIALIRQGEWTTSTKESTKAAQLFNIEELRRKIGEATVLMQQLQEENGKTVTSVKESTRMASEFNVDELKGKISEAEALLSGYEQAHGKAMEVTLETLDDLKKSGQLGPEAVSAFIQAFMTMVDKDFKGSAEDAGKIFKYAIGNIKDIFVGAAGLKMGVPILGTIGLKLSEITDTLTKDDDNWNAYTEALSRLGAAISSVVEGIFGLMPSTQGIVDVIIELINRAASWVEENRENIIGFFRNIADTIKEDVVPWIKESLLPAIQEFFAWVNENKGEILGFLKEMGRTIMDDVVPFVQDFLIPQFAKFSQWVFDNKDQIINLFDKLGDTILWVAETAMPYLERAMKWIEENPEKVENMVNMWAKWQGVGTILGIVGNIILSVGAYFLTFFGILKVISLFIMPFIDIIAQLAGAIVVNLGGAISAAVAVFVAFQVTVYALAKRIEVILNTLVRWFFWAKDKFVEWKDIWTNIIEDAANAIQNKDWTALGRSIIDGILAGLTMGPTLLFEAIAEIGDTIVDNFKDVLNIHSPSGVFRGLGRNVMEGFSLGIQDATNLVTRSMSIAATQTVSAAAPSITNANTYNTNYNQNLTINSGASLENIVQDFDMLSSLAGV